jgi:amidase/aspartyl-tRNA(Asn)/glutamyl-tRNA(Gln) amidotransferase subunit A
MTWSPLADADEICQLGATALARRYRDGTLSPVEVARACLARAETVQARCNAFTRIDHAGALAAAGAAEARWRAGRPLGAVGLLRRAGVVFLGQTTTPEFGWKAVTDSARTGITRNPWDPGLTSGGSSGGAGVAAATGAGVVHLGTDGGGSIRIPAAFCGIAGLKPSFSRVPAAPASPFGTVAHLGPMARTAEDAAIMLDALSGRDRRDWFQNPLPFPPVAGVTAAFAGQRIGVWRTPPGGQVAPEVAAALATCLDALEAAGARLREIALPFADELPELFRTHWFAGAAARLRGLDTSGIDPGLVEIAAAGAAIPLADYMAAMTRRAAFGAAMDDMMAELDLIVSPAVAIPPFAAGREVPEGSGMSRWIDWAGFSYPINLWQAPACVVPRARAAPEVMVGLQFIAPRGRDDAALAAARAWEAVTEAAA